MPKVFFTSIENEISHLLQGANESIKVAMTWLTNKNLFDILLNKLKEQISIEIILSCDDINFSLDSLDFRHFIMQGGKLYVANNTNLMHHKFCLIDNKILINGSYNWTRLAESSNHENIIIFEDNSELLSEFKKEFTNLKNVESILFNAIPSFSANPEFRQPEYNSIDYISSDCETNEKEYLETETEDGNQIKVEEIYRERTFNGDRFIPLQVYKMNGFLRQRALYFAWDIDNDLSKIRKLRKGDFFAAGKILGRLVSSEFPEFFWRIADEENLYWEINKYKKEDKIHIHLLVKEGETITESLKNLRYDLNKLEK